MDVSAVPVHLQTGGNVLPLAALYLSHLASQGLDLSKISGSVCGDPIAEWVLDGKPSASPDSLFDAVASWSKFVASKASKLRSIGVNAELWLEAGGSATQELAFALADAVEQMRALQKRGIPPAQFASQVRFSFSVGQQFFMEIAKFRAFRTLWARVASAFGVEPSTAKVFVHARTALYDKTLHDAHVNMLRVTTEAFSAVLGGVDSLHIGTFDEVSGSGDEFSRRIARNVHTLLSEEFSISETLDPAGGSWYVEKLTDELARKAWALFQETEKQGGLIASLRAGTPQSLVAATAAEKADGVSKRRTGIVGTNLFPNLKEKPLKRFEADEANQSALASAIASRRPASVPAGNASDIASLVAAATKGASLGQLHSLSSVPASGDAITSLRLTRAASGFEELRRASELWAARSGSRPKVFLAKMGPVLQHKARADFAAGFFATGGFESLGKQSFDTAEAAATAALASAAPVVVLCSTDETYPALVPIFAAAIKKASPSTVVILAGLPADKALTEQFKASGIDDFIHIRASVRDLLAKLLKQIGALS